MAGFRFGRRSQETAEESKPEKEAEMSMVSRRQFLATTSLTAGTILLAGRFALAEEPAVTAPAKAKSGTDLVTLGKTGIKTSMLGIGTGMTGGSEVRNLGQDAFVSKTMANRLTMAQIDAILTLHATRHSNREIADLLTVDRGTVGKYIAEAAAQNPPDQTAVGAPPTGNEERPIPPGESLSSGPPSDCEPFREQIQTKIEQGLTAKRISQDLQEEYLTASRFSTVVYMGAN